MNTKEAARLLDLFERAAADENLKDLARFLQAISPEMITWEEVFQFRFWLQQMRFGDFSR